ETAQSQMQRTGAAVQADTMLHSAVRCEFALKIGSRRSLSKAGGIANLRQRLQYFGPQSPVLRVKIQIRYSFHFRCYLNLETRVLRRLLLFVMNVNTRRRYCHELERIGRETVGDGDLSNCASLHR